MYDELPLFSPASEKWMSFPVRTLRREKRTSSVLPDSQLECFEKGGCCQPVSTQGYLEDGFRGHVLNFVSCHRLPACTEARGASTHWGEWIRAGWYFLLFFLHHLACSPGLSISTMQVVCASPGWCVHRQPSSTDRQKSGQSRHAPIDHCA